MVAEKNVSYDTHLLFPFLDLRGETAILMCPVIGCQRGYGVEWVLEEEEDGFWEAVWKVKVHQDRKHRGNLGWGCDKNTTENCK